MPGMENNSKSVASLMNATLSGYVPKSKAKNSILLRQNILNPKKVEKSIDFHKKKFEK
jgi:hypothetical protein